MSNINSSIQKTWDSQILYNKKPNFYNNKFYIHLHNYSIGRMQNGKAETDTSLAAIFQNYKDGKDSIVQKAVTNQYLKALKANIKVTTTNNDILDEVFDITNNNAEAMLNQIHRDMQEGLEKHINTDKLVQLLSNEKLVTWSTKNENVKKLQQALSTKNGNYNAVDGLKALDVLLKSMADTVSLINSPLGPKLAEAILIENNSTNNFSTIKGYGRNLQKVLNDFKKNNKAFLVDDKLMQEALLNFENIIKPLATLQVEKKKGSQIKQEKTTIGKLQGRVTNNFFPNLAEILAAQISQSAISGPLRIMNDARRTGEETAQIQITDPNGVYSEKGFFDDSGMKQDKADNVFENVFLSAKSLNNNTSGYIQIDIGISSKSYVTNNFGIENSLSDFNDVYSLGGGMTLGNAFRILLGDINANIRDKYLGYNILAHDQSELPLSLRALQDVLLTRSIVYLASGRTNKNIAQFMMLNGKLLSIWDIIKYALNNNIGLTSSQLSKKDANSRSGIYMSIESREKIIQYGKSRFWARRVVKTNDAIEAAAMKVHIIPKQIINNVANSTI